MQKPRPSTEHVSRLPRIIISGHRCRFPDQQYVEAVCLQLLSDSLWGHCQTNEAGPKEPAIKDDQTAR